MTSSVPLVYRFSVAPTPAGSYTVVRDYSTRNTFAWAPLQEGAYNIQVTVKEGYSATATISKAVPFSVTSRVKGTSAVVSPTANPLVALYSAPPCSAGQIVVRFQRAGLPVWKSTTAQPCQAGLSRNFLVAGMLAKTTYEMVHVIVNAGTVITSTPLSFTTGKPPASMAFPTFTVLQAPGAQSDKAENMIFHTFIFSPWANGAAAIGTDLAGRLTWYTAPADLSNTAALRIEQGVSPSGSVVNLLGNDGQQSTGWNVLRVIDLAGNPLQETNVQAVNAQLTARGDQIIYSFHHDALRLPNGDTAVLGVTQETITTTPIMGDMLIVLDHNFQVVWTWDAFQHLDPYRGPTLGETCGNSFPQCPVPGGPSTIDWLHTNAIDYSPSDGNIILSVRNQDWVIKIRYENGRGDGTVLWRLGPGGDFTIAPSNPMDPYPWFSHQHDANYINPTTLELFDDGNTRCAVLPPPCHSRGQVYVIDERTRAVTQTVSADLGNYSSAMGSAQRLSNGNYNFVSGAVVSPPILEQSQDIEVLPDGTKTFVLQVNIQEYRAWRLASMDSPINPPCPTCPPAP